MKTEIHERDMRYYVQDGYLIREVKGTGCDTRIYRHRCSKKTYETVAHVAEETPSEGKGITGYQIAIQEELPFSQTNVAMEFLKERGIVDVRYRRCYPTSHNTHLDAMVEFHALEEATKRDKER